MSQHTARVEQVYADRQIKVGEVFDVEPQHVELLSLLGRIDPAARAQPVAAQSYGTRAMAAAPARAKRPYNRKAA